MINLDGICWRVAVFILGIIMISTKTKVFLLFGLIVVCLSIFDVIWEVERHLREDD